MFVLPSHLASSGRVRTRTARYTTTQTGAALWTPAAGLRVIIYTTQIQAGGTTAGELQLWWGSPSNTAYSRGTDRAIFDGEFKPSATVAPGVVQAGVWLPPSADYVLRVTTSAALNPLTITVWGYELV